MLRRSGSDSPELARLVELWDDFSASLKGAILAIADSFVADRKDTRSAEFIRLER